VVPNDSGTTTRQSDTHGEAGRISSNASMVVPGGVLSAVAVQADDGLRLIRWHVSPQRAFRRAVDSGSQAGDARLVKLPQNPLNGPVSIVTALRTEDGELLLISWSAPS
jgi:hypothetical protein